MFRFKPTPIVIAPFVAWACSKPDEPPARDSAKGSAPTPAAVAVEFDPAATHAGDMVMGLTVDTIAAQRAQTGESVGMARFSGTLVLSGQTVRHPDGDDYAFPCFEADSASARQLPRWAGDTRRPWFCFENREEAKQQFGGSTAGVAATIRVTRFTINKNLSDAVNSARLVGIVSRADSSAASRSRCYTSAGSVLGRAPGTAAPAPRDVSGWVRIDGLSSAADSGSARLVDSDARFLSATWRRIGGDSLAIVGFDDFVRVEMRVRDVADRLSGSATARSDAAATRDSAGRVVPFQRRWSVDAASRPCDSMPAVQ